MSDLYLIAEDKKDFYLLRNYPVGKVPPTDGEVVFFQDSRWKFIRMYTKFWDDSNYLIEYKLLDDEILL